MLLVTLTPAVPARAGLDRTSLGMSGSVALDYFSSNHDLDDREHFPGANLVLKQRLPLADGLRWTAEARVLAQQVGHEEEDAEHGSVRSLRYDDEVISELREGFLELARPRWELRAGKQIIVWGRADEINPTDVVTPKNFRLLMPDGQADYRFGTPALKLDYFPALGLRLTGVWTPVFTPSVIPLATPAGVRLDDALPAVRLDNGSAGVKLDRSGGKIDASLAYFYGFNLLPEPRVTQADTDPASGTPRVAVALAHSRQHMIGGDFATASGRFSYRGEVAYVHTDNADGRRLDAITPYLFYVLGVERSFGDDLNLIVQYVGRWVAHRIDPARALDDPDAFRGMARSRAAREMLVINQQLDTVQNGWSVRLAKRWWHETLDGELLAVHFFERNDFFLRPKIAYDVSDGWRATIGGEIFGGPTHSFFGRLKDNTGAFAELRYSF
jgi:Protein of unknown function (DUF1302)